MNFKNLLLVVYLFVFSVTAMGQFQNVRVSPLNRTSPNEVSIAVNPLNGANLAAGANLNFAYTSSDSGKTWQETVLTSTFGVGGDPCLIYDAEGHLYYGHLANGLDRIVVQKSTLNGTSFSNGSGIGLNQPKDQDKEWMIADRTNSQYRNNLYISWTEFDKYGSPASSDSTRILLSYSTDRGITWSQPVRVSDRQGNCIDDDQTVEGAVPAVGPNGEVYVAWAGWNEIMFDKSLDGGKTFGIDKFVANQPNGWAYDIPGIYRCNGMPITLCDISNSPYRGDVYIVWGDTRNGVNDGDIFLIKSTNGGNTWGSTVRINNDASGKHQFFPWAAVDQTTGYIYVVFYDRRNYTDNRTDVYLAVSKDGGEHFSNFKISDSPFKPDNDIFFGDYTCITAHNGMVYPIWMRMDSKFMSVWMARINQNQLVAVDDDGNEESVPKGYSLSQNYPNPFNPSTMISFTIKESCRVSIKIYDISGKEVDTAFEGYREAGTHKINYTASSLSSGRYFYELKAGDVSLRKKMILQK